jgi:hypothetical protein
MQVIIGSSNSVACLDKTIYLFAVSGGNDDRWDYFMPKANKGKAFSEIKRDIVLKLFKNVMDSAITPSPANDTAVPVVLTSIGEPNEVEPKEAVISPLESMVKDDADINKRDSAGGKLEIRVCE